MANPHKKPARQSSKIYLEVDKARQIQTPEDKKKASQLQNAFDSWDDTIHLWFNAIFFFLLGFTISIEGICFFFYAHLIEPVCAVFVCILVFYLTTDTIWLCIAPDIVVGKQNPKQNEAFIVAIHHILVLIGAWLTYIQFALNIVEIDSGYDRDEKYFIYTLGMCSTHIEWNTFCREVRRLMKRYDFGYNTICYSILSLLFDVTWVLFRLILTTFVSFAVLYTAITHIHNVKLRWTWIFFTPICLLVTLIQYFWTFKWIKGVKRRYCRRFLRNNQRRQSHSSRNSSKSRSLPGSALKHKNKNKNKNKHKNNEKGGTTENETDLETAHGANADAMTNNTLPAFKSIDIIDDEPMHFMTLNATPQNSTPMNATPRASGINMDDFQYKMSDDDDQVWV